MDYLGIITMEPGKRGGKPWVRGLRITVYDVLDQLAGAARTGLSVTPGTDFAVAASARAAIRQ